MPPTLVLVFVAYKLPLTVFVHVQLALRFLGRYSLAAPGPATFHQG